MDLVVVGHVEWITFLTIDRVLQQGEIALASEQWEEAAGGGGVAAVELARMNGKSRLVTALGGDTKGQSVASALGAYGVTVQGAVRPEPHRTGITLIDPQGERTIIVKGPAQGALGADQIPVGAADGVYFCKGDAEMLREARRARVLVATARVLPILQAAGVRVDALVRSKADPSERYAPGDLDPEPEIVVTTEGAQGGSYTTRGGRSGRYRSAPLPGPLRDSYGAGDSFAAGLTFALSEGRPLEEALCFAASRGALALTRRGAHGI